MAQEGDQEKWLWFIDSQTGRLCTTTNVVRDPAFMVIHEPMSVNQYWTTHIIGAASGATVYRAAFYPDFETLEALPHSDTFVAIKVFNAKQTAEIEKLSRDLLDSAFLANHPNIIGIKTKFCVGDKLYVVMPFMSGGSLQSIISSRFQEGFPQECVAIALRETLKGLSYIHGMGQLHRFIDIRYIFLCQDSQVIKLAFGASLYEENTNGNGNGNGNGSYSSMPHCKWPAPEAVCGYGTKADIWLIGVTALQLAYGARVGGQQGMEAMINKFRAQNLRTEEEKISEPFKEMVTACLDPNPSRRPQADELLRHGFFNNCQDVSYFSNMVFPRPQ